MDNTRAARRSWISSNHPTITAILKRYPRLQDMNQAVNFRVIFVIDNIEEMKSKDEYIVTEMSVQLEFFFINTFVFTELI